MTLPSGVVEIEGEIADRHWILIELAQIVKSQLSGDAREHSVVDEFHRHEDWRNTVDRCRNAIARTDDNRRDHGGPAHQATDHGRLPVRAVLGRVHLVKTDRARRALIATTHEVDDRSESGASGREPFRIGRAMIDQRVGHPIIAIEDEDVIVIEVRLQPRADALIDPIVIERLANVLDCAIG